MKRMTSRERVIAAMERREADRTPMMFWIEPHAAVKMATRVRPPKNPAERALWNGVAGLSRAMPRPDLAAAVQLAVHPFMKSYLRELGSDIIDVNYGSPLLWVRKARADRESFSIVDMYGIERGIGGQYLEPKKCPCPDPESLAQYRFPDMSSPVHYAHVAMVRRMFPDAFLVSMCPGVQDHGQFIHPMANLYSGMIEYPDVIKGFFRKMRDHAIQIIRGALGAGADAVLVLDDYGTQNSMFISKSMWKEFTFPVLADEIEEIHRCGGKAMLHSCGTVMPLVDLFVEAGLDALHPFQPLPGNNLPEAVEKFGDRLTFITGIDVQRIGAMTPEQLHADILETARTASRKKGFILAHTNGLQQDTPEENLRAMLRAIKAVRNGAF